tara:strand:+ start:110 stop:427 length:318 start_codon:yes stop_codon:yes gene_type:complete
MEKLLIFQVAAANALTAPVSALTGIDLVNSTTINFSFVGVGLSAGNTKSAIVTCTITDGTYIATMKELSEYFYATGSMKLPYLDVAQAAGGLSNITACTTIAITQ